MISICITFNSYSQGYYEDRIIVPNIYGDQHNIDINEVINFDEVLLENTTTEIALLLNTIIDTAQGNQTIVFGAKTYQFNEKLILKSNINIIGQGADLTQFEFSNLNDNLIEKI